MLTINAFTAADSVVIPTAADIMSLQGVNRVYETIKEVREQSNPKINVDGLLLFRYSNRTIISRQLAEEAALVAASMRCSVYRATIREAVQVRESQVEQQSLFEYAPTAKVTDDFRLFINELTGEYEEEADKIRAEREAAYNDK
jgi:chromosome partitioning protein